MEFPYFSVYVPNEVSIHKSLIMEFKANTHSYLHNIGIDYQPIFFSERNKAFFRKKAIKLISPYAQILTIILAENQFHILIKVKDNYKGKALNHNIGILLRSYTRAINKERFRIGSLFRRHTRSFSKISDIPKNLRKFIAPFIEYFQKGQLVNYGKSIGSFLNFISNRNIWKEDPLIKDYQLPFEDIFEHPYKLIKQQLNI